MLCKNPGRDSTFVSQKISLIHSCDSFWLVKGKCGGGGEGVCVCVCGGGAVKFLNMGIYQSNSLP